MIPREQLPEDAEKWNSVSVSFPYLTDNTPHSEDAVIEYIKIESSDTDSANKERLKFVRTAQVSDSKFWLWEYTEDDGTIVYVTLSTDPNGHECLGLAEANGLSP